MIRSFVTFFLPEDEYKRLRVLYFISEAVFLMSGILLLGSVLNNYWLKCSLNKGEFTFFLMMIPMLMVLYTYFRYIFSGIEYTEVTNKKDYKKERRVVVKSSVIFGALFFIILLIFKGIPTNYDERMDLIALPIISMIFYFLFYLVSLKRSIKKNKELDD